MIAVKRSELMIGGAGNVARNLVALGARCIFVGVVGDDDAGRALNEGAGRPSAASNRIWWSTQRARPRARCASSPSIIPRICCAPTGKRPPPVDASIEDALIGHVVKAMPRVGAVVLSDYAKGALTPRVIRAVIDAANEARQAGDRRSEGPRLRHLSRRDRDHAEPAGACRRHPQRRRDRRGDRAARRRAGARDRRARPCW